MSAELSNQPLVDEPRAAARAPQARPVMGPEEIAPPFDPLALLWRRRWTLVLAAVLGLALSMLHIFLAPKWYVSHVTLVPVDSPRVGSGEPPDPDLDPGANDVERIADTLRSDTVANAVVAAVPLGDDEELARRALWRRCRIETQKKSRFLVLTCEDRDPQRVREMLARFVAAADETLRKVSSRSARDERRFLEARVADAQRNVEDASRRLREFQAQHQVVDLSEQARASLSAIAQLEGERLAKQMQLAYLDGFASRDEVTSVQLRHQLAIVNRKLRVLEGGGSVDPTRPEQSSGMLPTIADIPTLRYESERLYRDQKARETVYLLVMRMFEIAKLNEARDTSAFQVLDPPRVPLHPTRPRKLLVVGIDTAAVFLLASLLVIAPAWRRAWLNRKA